MRSEEEGFSLLEALLAITLGGGLLLMMVGTFFCLKKDFSIAGNDSIFKGSVIQSNGRFLTNFFSDIFASGLDCANKEKEPNSERVVFQVRGEFFDGIEALKINHCVFARSKIDFFSVYYFVKNEKLYRKIETSGFSNKRLLAYGVKSMRLKYAILCESSQEICSYLNFQEVKNWSRIGGVLISFNLCHKDVCQIWPIFYALPGRGGHE